MRLNIYIILNKNMKIKMQVENRIPAKSTVKEKKGTIIKGPNVFSSFAK